MKARIHTEDHTDCISTEEDNYCFDSLTSMHNYYDSIKPWYKKIWEQCYYPVYRFFYWTVWDNIRPGTIKHLYQRMRQGWSYQDCWSIDWYIAEILPKMLRHLKKNNHGHPQGVTENEWHEILEAIAHGFDLQYQILEYKLFDFSNKKQKKVIKNMFHKNPKLYENCKIMTTKDRAAIKKSWRLFQKYFYNLWD